MTTPSEMRPGAWQVPECPWLIEYLPPLLDEMRLAVVDAFFSVPRGGAEVGGLLFGTHDDTSVRIQAFRPMECEHALGPTFTLSAKDLARLEAQLAGSAADPTLRGLELVGWYHSHTRSEIFLSAPDLEIYSRFFPKPWQVALVLRPAGMKPTRAGFFFRDRQGAIHSSASHREFVVGTEADAQPGNGRHPVAQTVSAPPARPLPANPPAVPPAEVKTETPAASRAPADALPPAGNQAPALPPAAGMLQRIETLPIRPPVELAPSIEKRPAEFVPPAYMLPPEPGRSRVRLWLALALLAAAGVTAYFTSGYWKKSLAAKPPSLHLQALDIQGQLRIQWDRAGLQSQDVQGGVMEIIDGPATTAVPLDAAKVRAGSFQYARRSEMVEVHMTVRTAQGKSLEEFTSYIGQPPSQAAGKDRPPGAAELEAERARGDLKKEELRSLELQRSLDQMKQLLRKEEERKRVANQMPAENVPPAASAPPPPRPASAPTQTASNANPAPASNPPAAVVPPPKPQPPPTVPSAVVKPPAATPDKPPLTAERPVQTPPQPASRPSTTPPQPTPQQQAAKPPSTPPQLPQPQASKPPVTTPQPAPQQPAAKPPAAPPTLPAQPLSGRWVSSAASKSGSPYPPESTTLVMKEENGQVRGNFTGRYRVPKNLKFNPRVIFSFAGPVHPGSSKYAFTAADGMKGEIELIRLPGRHDAIEVVWKSERDKLTFDDLYFRLP